MLYYFNELLENGLSKYQIEKKVASNELFKISRGIYSDEELPNDLSVIVKKHPNVILTLNSAFYYYDLTDKIPEYYYLATDIKAYIIKDSSVKQVFMKKDFLKVGLSKCKIEETELFIYDKERLLIELVRYKTKLPYELYKEVINNYRKIKNELDFMKVYKYAQIFNSSYIMQTIEKEVM
ncbi:MAG: hypothetical protein HFJ53_04370 [Clostridia bacterium]|jgi:hypothetical protein|nr:hypothetical protein [Clostridia bacterium]